MALALLAVAANLRTAITSVPPLLDAISADLGLSHAAAGALTTLPVLCMGLFAPVASVVAHRLGAVAAVLGAILAILAGTASRFAADSWPILYLGTALAGVGIALAGTLLPRLVKTFFPPERAGLITGLYMLAMMGGAALQLGPVGAAGRPPRLVAGLARLVVGARPRRRARLGTLHAASQPAPHPGRGRARATAVATPARRGSSPPTSPSSRGPSTRR